MIIKNEKSKIFRKKLIYPRDLAEIKIREQVGSRRLRSVLHYRISSEFVDPVEIIVSQVGEYFGRSIPLQELFLYITPYEDQSLS